MTKKPPRTPKRWLFSGILSDTPISEEDTFYPEEYIKDILRVNHPGIRIDSLKVTALPERPKKQGQNPEKTEEKSA